MLSRLSGAASLEGEFGAAVTFASNVHFAIFCISDAITVFDTIPESGVSSSRVDINLSVIEVVYG